MEENIMDVNRGVSKTQKLEITNGTEVESDGVGGVRSSVMMEAKVSI
jgi:hypothetical protein